MKLPQHLLLGILANELDYQLAYDNAYSSQVGLDEFRPLCEWVCRYRKTTLDDDMNCLCVDAKNMTPQDAEELLNSIPAGYWRSEFRAACKSYGKL